VSTTAVGISVMPVAAPGLSLAVNENVPMNPASTMKLVTTLAGLELLGRSLRGEPRRWRRHLLWTGALEGDLFLRGSGDPRFVVEHLWLLVQRVRESVSARSVATSCWTAVLSTRWPMTGCVRRRVFAPLQRRTGCAAAQLQERQLPFRTRPRRQAGAGLCHPQLAGMTVPSTVRAVEGACNDWRGRLGGDFTEPMRPQFRGGFPLACGDRVWHVSLLNHTQYVDAVFRALWHSSAESGAVARATASCPSTRGGWHSMNPSRSRR